MQSSIQSSRGPKSLHYPDYSADNPYQSLMFRYLHSQGCESEAFSGRARAVMDRVRTDRADILHIHWISKDVIAHPLHRSIAIMLGFYAALILWRLRGRRSVWTVHNLDNHDKRRLWLDRFHARTIARLVDRVLVHGETARPRVARKLGIRPARISVVHHGNYAGMINSSAIDRGHAGRRFLFFGQIRDYKGVPDLITAFRKLPGEHALHIAGRVVGETLRQQIETLSTADPRISLELDYISDAALERALAWSDVVALPYRDIFTSGSLLMALTAGRPVVAPRSGLIPDYVDATCAYLYEPADQEALSGALRLVADETDIAARAAAALHRAESFDWSIVGADLLAIYRELCFGGRRLAVRKKNV